jgi:hypothetical protein
MRNLIKLEEFFLFLLSIYLFTQLDYAWWWYALLFLAPDLGMIGYLFSPRVGALTYNLLHHKAIAVALFLIGAWLSVPPVQLAGVIILGHSSADRVLGYGLKYPDAFRHTHLGWIGGVKGQPGRVDTQPGWASDRE